ncbi:putative homing endonuclease [Aeromonas phage phiA8-29]|uniref:Putative homing endonuclease n=1 Tax=Aeromonas phage phiA8-29 TaxID=1978922 RepID=A0A1W6DY96_9CAUD|nr:homing endonuclease [Aeromonas phage phiA8-29]ARK07836.1 putative homing endonuclease [Aeromonas phage phiA8-29]
MSWEERQLLPSKPQDLNISETILMDYQKVYTSLISKRIAEPLKKSKELYTELHHIVPRCLGGSDNPENLVRLTAREHFIAHRLLAKMYPSVIDLRFAALKMARKRGSSFMNSRLFELYKTEHAEFMSKFMSTAWKDEEIRERASASHKKNWKNEEYREKMAVVMESEEYREKMSAAIKKSWGDEEFREKRSAAIKKSQESEEFREKRSAAIKKSWEDEHYVRKVKEGVRIFLETNPWPWQRTKAQTKRIWVLAATFYELRMDESVKGKSYGYARVSNDFCGGKYRAIFQKMVSMFKEGWIPRECPAYLEEFGDRM